MCAHGGAVLSVETDTNGVEQRLRAGALVCPSCSCADGMGPGQPQLVHGPTSPVRIAPRRSRCTRCRVIHVLLPVRVLAHRADIAAVIGAVLVAKATGWGIGGSPRRSDAGGDGVGDGCVEAVRMVFTRWCRALSPDRCCPVRRVGVGDAIAVITVAATGSPPGSGSARWRAGSRDRGIQGPVADAGLPLARVDLLSDHRRVPDRKVRLVGALDRDHAARRVRSRHERVRTAAQPG